MKSLKKKKKANTGALFQGNRVQTREEKTSRGPDSDSELQTESTQTPVITFIAKRQ